MLIQALSDKADSFVKSIYVDHYRSCFKAGLFGYDGVRRVGKVFDCCPSDPNFRTRPSYEPVGFSRSLNSNLSQLALTKKFYPDIEQAGSYIAGVIYIDVQSLFRQCAGLSDFHIGSSLADVLGPIRFIAKNNFAAYTVAIYLLGDSSSSLACFNRSDHHTDHFLENKFTVEHSDCYYHGKLDILDDRLIDRWFCNIAYALCKSSYRFLRVLIQEAYTRSPRSRKYPAYVNHNLLAQIWCHFDQTDSEVRGFYRFLKLAQEHNFTNHEESLENLRNEIIFNIEAIIATISYHWGSGYWGSGCNLNGGGDGGEYRDFITLGYLQRLLQRLRAFDHRSSFSKAGKVTTS